MTELSFRPYLWFGVLLNPIFLFTPLHVICFPLDAGNAIKEFNFI